jgi:hypothetical protein
LSNARINRIKLKKAGRGPQTQAGFFIHIIWIPASAEMTSTDWIPACAGITKTLDDTPFLEARVIRITSDFVKSSAGKAREL